MLLAAQKKLSAARVFIKTNAWWGSQACLIWKQKRRTWRDLDWCSEVKRASTELALCGNQGEEHPLSSP
eukprot:1030138-Karenia_brevis.AAC.1